MQDRYDCSVVQWLEEQREEESAALVLGSIAITALESVLLQENVKRVT